MSKYQTPPHFGHHSRPRCGSKYLVSIVRVATTAQHWYSASHSVSNQATAAAGYPCSRTEALRAHARGSHPPDVLLGAGAGGSTAMHAVGAVHTK
jgi:hypothetical protein